MRRKILNPVSLLELSDQLRLIKFVDAAIAMRLLGAAGTPLVPGRMALVVATGDSPPLKSTAVTR